MTRADAVQTMKVGEVATYINGYPFSPSDYSASGRPIIRIQNLTGNEYQTNRFSGTLDEKYRVQYGDILISWSASLGIHVWEEDDAWLNQHIFKVVFDKLSINKSFFIHQMSYLLSKSESLAHGATMKHLTKKTFSNMPFRLPSPDTQEKEAATLDTINKLIRLYSSMTICLDSAIKSRFVEMCGDPVLNNMHWPIDKLSNNVKLINGRAYKQNELLAKGKYRVLRVGNFFSNSSWYYSNLELEEEKYCVDGDLLYAWSASFGPRIWHGKKTIFHYHIWKLIVDNNVYNKYFLYHLLKYAEPSFLSRTHGIGMAHLTKAGMEQTPFIVPPLPLQEEFAALAGRADKSRFAIKQTIERLEALKGAFMQRYFG